VVRRALREPERRPRLRRDLARALRPATPPAPVPRPVLLTDQGPPPPPRYDVRALLVAEPALVADLVYEWRQSTPAPQEWRHTLEAGVDLVVLTTQALVSGPWAGGDSAAELIIAAGAARVPVVVWDTQPVDGIAALASGLRDVTALRTVDPGRVPAWREALPGVAVDALAPGVQPRRFGPVRPVGGVPRERTVGLVVEGPGALDVTLNSVLKSAEALGLAVFGDREDVVAAYSTKIAERIVADAGDDGLRAAYRMSSAWFVPAPPDAPLPARVLALAASQTPFVTGPQAAVAGVFGDLAPGATASSSSAVEAARSLRAFVRQSEHRDRIGLRLHRAVLAGHTSGHRVDTLLADAGLGRARRPRRVSAVVPSNRPGQLDHVLEFIGRQDYLALQLVLVLHGLDVDESLKARAKDAGVQDLVIVQAPADVTLGACMNLGVDAADGDLIAKMDDDNVYGTAYLTDLVHAFDYTGAGVVGKLAHYVHLAASGAVLLRGAEHEHTYVRLVQGGSMVMDGDLVREARFEDVPRAVDTTFLDKVGAGGVLVYSADRFNYVSVRRQDATSHTWQVSDLEMLSTADARLCFYGDPRTHIDV
jgi:Glycosyl transferase family 2